MEKINNTIQKVINSDLLTEELCFIPNHGLSDKLLEKWNYFENYGQKKSSSYIAFLKQWNGVDLDVIRFHGLSSDKEILEIQLDQEHSLLVIASDPAGFLYGFNNEGKVFSLDTDSNIKKCVAESFDDFVLVFLFGCRAQDFLGSEWQKQLKQIGIL